MSTVFSSSHAPAGGVSLELVEAGAGRAVAVLGGDFARSEAHAALVERFRVIALTGPHVAPAALGGAVADWIEGSGLETVSLVAFGPAAPAALHAAARTGERTPCLVLVSPWSLLADAVDAETTALMRTVAAPKAVLIGSADPRARPGVLSVFKTALSRSNPVMVFGAGEDVAGDRPQAFASVAGDFLDRQGRFAFATETVAVND